MDSARRRAREPFSPRWSDADQWLVRCHGFMNASETLTTDRSTPVAGHLGGGGRLTPQERAEAGRAARAGVARAQGEWQPSPDRADPVDAARGAGDQPGARAGPAQVRPDAGVPVHVLPRGRLPDGRGPGGCPRTGLNVQLCGDAHLSNFGTFAAPDRRLVFSLTDFDESLPGPFEWDVKRLVASFAVAGRDRGFNDAEREAVNLAVGASYREAMRDLARDAEAGRLVRAAGRRRDRRPC